MPNRSLQPMSEFVVFTPSRTKAGLSLLGSILFVALTVPLVSQRPLLAWLGGGFFAICGVVAASMLVTNRFFVRLTPEGLQIGGLLKQREYRWADLERFTITKVRGVGSIRIVSRKQKSSSLWGGQVIGNHYNASLGSICDALNEWHSRHARLAA